MASSPCAIRPPTAKARLPRARKRSLDERGVLGAERVSQLPRLPELVRPHRANQPRGVVSL